MWSKKIVWASRRVTLCICGSFSSSLIFWYFRTYVFQPAFAVISDFKDQLQNKSDSWFCLSFSDLSGPQCGSWKLPMCDRTKLRTALILGAWPNLSYQHQTHFVLSCICPRLNRSHLAAGEKHQKIEIGIYWTLVFCLSSVSWNCIKSTYMNHGHLVRQDLYPNQQLHGCFQTYQDHSIAGTFSWYYPISQLSRKWNQWLHHRAHHTGGYMKFDWLLPTC